MDVALSLLRYRLDESARTTLRDIVSGLPALRRISRPLSERLSRHEATIRRELSSAGARQTLAAGMASGFLAYLLDRYQYVRPSASDKRAVLDAYRAMTEVIPDAATDLAGALQHVIGQHHDRLRLITIGMLDKVGALDDVLDGAEPICRQYSPALQCRVLGLTDDDLAGPLLDIGCGETAELVGFLRGHGCAAFGIDRLAPAGDHTMRGDWFDLPMVAGGWRTIVAHLSFSLHFIHAHLHAEDEARRYAVAYMSILERLQPGGSFVYAPSLPFIEPLLDPRRFRVEVKPVRPSPDEAWSSCRVTRLDDR